MAGKIKDLVVERELTDEARVGLDATGCRHFDVALVAGRFFHFVPQRDICGETDLGTEPKRL